MPVTVNQNSIVRTQVGNKTRITGTLSFTTYTTGGPTITAPFVGLDQIETFSIGNPNGLIFTPSVSTDRSTVSLKGFTAGSGGTITLTATQDEVKSVTGGTGVSAPLTNIPVASVDNVYITAGGTTGAAIIVPTGSVANIREVSINYTTGVLQFRVADAVTSCKVTYAKATGSVTGGTTGSEIANATNLAGLGNVSFTATGI